MLETLIISIYFSYKNALIAKAKGLNSVIWVVLSVLAFVAALFVGATIVMALFYNGPVNENAVKEFMKSRPIHAIFIYFSAVGGCLLVRYNLEQKQSKLPPKAEKE